MQEAVTQVQLNLLLLSVLIFCIGTYTGLDLMGKVKGKYWIWWLLLCSLSLAIGKWSLHYINMIGLFNHNYLTFNIELTILSIFVSLFSSTLVFFILARKNATLLNGMLAGSLYAIGVAVMHFTGMMAMHPDIKMEYDPLGIGRSVFASFILSILTFVFIYHSSRQQKFRVKEKLMATIFMCISVIVLHFMAIEATTFRFDEKSHMLNHAASHISPFDIGSMIFLFLSVLWFISFLLRYQEKVEYKIRKQHYDSLFSNNPDFVCALDSQGKITALNKIGLNMIRLEKDDIIGNHFTFLLAENDEKHQLLFQKIEEGLNGQFSLIETDILCKNTEEQYSLSITIIPITLRKVHGIFIIAKDLTDQKKNQQLIRDMQQNLEITLANQEGLTLKFIKHENQFIHTLCEGLLLKKLGLKKIDVLNKNLYDFLPEEVAFEKDVYYRRAWDGHDISYEINYNNITYYMSLKPIFVDEKVVEVIGSAIDITNLKQTQMKLEKSEQLYRSVVTAMSEGLVVIDKQGKAMTANENGAKILKVPYDTLKEFNIYSTDWSFVKEDFTLYKQNELPAVRTLEFLESTQNTLIGFKKENEPIIWLSLNSEPLIQDNELKGAVITYSDMTEQKLHQLTLMETNSMLEIAVKEVEEANKAKSVFLSRMSHDLRTPLNSILGYTQILMSKIEDPTAIRMVSKVYKAGNHLLDLINKILDFSMIEAGEVKLNCKKVNVNLIINDALHIVKPLMIEEKITANLEIDETRPLFLNVDPVRFQQIMINLLTNAIKYNKVGGEIVIGSKVIDEEFAHIFVKDTGIGIPENDYNVIFKPFKRLHKKNVEGSGIGLTLVEQLVTMLGGTFGVSSVEDEGSIFWVELPIKNHKSE